MKSPDVIKKGLWHCSEDGCKKCPYEDDCNMADGFSVLAYDALTLIKQYESDLINLQRLFATAESRANLLEAERDAAVEDIKEAHDSYCECVTCKNYRINADCQEPPDTFCPNCSHDNCPCKGCSSNLENWQWRGVQKEE